VARRKARFQDFESRYDNGKFVRITTDMMDSEAWQDLSIHARYLYLEMKRRYNGDNCRTFNFPHSVGRKLMTANAFTKAVNDLIRHGFIICVTFGRVNRIASEYRYAARWHNWPTMKDDPKLIGDPMKRLKRSKTNRE
jgi:hypothetical protein